MLELISDSTGKTKLIGKYIGEVLKAKDVLALFGELGAGKTVFIQGLALGLGISDIPVSPSFVIINEYQGKIPLYHVDLYRLSEGRDIEELGIEEYFEKSGVTVIEWAERAREFLPETSINIEIDILDESKRKIRISGEDIERFKKILLEHKLIKEKNG